MGLRCSLLGHDYADRDVERERADHGDEMVTTVRTTETCRRCGHRRVVSENTEIAATGAAAARDSRAGDEGDEPSSETREPTGRPDHERAAGEDGASEQRAFGPTAAAATSRSLEESELRCPACEFREPVLGSALRAGDSCPDCGQGYLARRTRKG